MPSFSAAGPGYVFFFFAYAWAIGTWVLLVVGSANGKAAAASIGPVKRNPQVRELLEVAAAYSIPICFMYCKRGSGRKTIFGHSG